MIRGGQGPLKLNLHIGTQNAEAGVLKDSVLFYKTTYCKIYKLRSIYTFILYLLKSKIASSSTVVRALYGHTDIPSH